MFQGPLAWCEDNIDKFGLYLFYHNIFIRYVPIYKLF